MKAEELSWEACARWVGERQRARERVVFTNGCFDLLHAGHIHLLQAARRLGDLLVVGLNDDASVERLKGRGRPFISLADRLTILGALEAVDALVIFPRGSGWEETEEPAFSDTPQGLLRYLRPDVLVKGGDYRPEEVVGREFAGEVSIVPLLEGRSTTALMQRLAEATPVEIQISE